MRRGVVGGGNFIVDYVKVIDHYPAEQTLSEIRGEYIGSGGGPYNVLLGLARLGAAMPLAAIGRIGDDDAGRLIAADCAAHGIDPSGLKVTPGEPTSYTIVAVDEGSGRRTFFHRRGANARLGPEDFDFAATTASHFHYGYLMLLDRLDGGDETFGTAAARVLAEAKAAGLTTSIDLVSEDSDRSREILPAALKFADIVFMNEFEAERASGVALTDRGVVRIDRLADVRAALQPAGTLVVHWPEGAAACEGDSIALQGCVEMPPEKIVSAVGSGDAFAAGYLLGFTRGGGVEERLKLGACCAASCMAGYTCTDSILPESECLHLGEAHGFHKI